MNDMLILDSNDYMIRPTMKILTDKFDIKDMCVLDVVLRINIFKTYDSLVLSQSHYI